MKTHLSRSYPLDLHADHNPGWKADPALSSIEINTNTKTALLRGPALYLLVRDCGSPADPPDAPGRPLNGPGALTIQTAGVGQLQTIHALAGPDGSTQFIPRNTTILCGCQNLRIEDQWEALVALQFESWDPAGLHVSRIAFQTIQPDDPADAPQ